MLKLPDLAPILARLPPHFVAGLRYGTIALSGLAGVLLVSLSIFIQASGMSSSANAILGKYIPIIGFVALVAGLSALLVTYYRGVARTEKAEKAQQAALARERAMEPRQRILNGAGDRFALEIRGLSMFINEGFSQDEIWKPFTSVKPMQSILSQRIGDYAQSADERSSDYSIASRVAAKNVALDAMHLWPVPGFAAQPPSHPSAQESAGEYYSNLFRRASLVYSFGIWVDDINGEDASPLVDKLFAFFDAHPEVPQAIIMTKDGDIVREYMQGSSARRIEGPHKPDKPLSIVTLLVSRTDRVDRFIRPYAIHEDTIARTPQQTQYDYIKLYNFYWKEDHRYGEGRHSRYSSTTMSASHWASILPQFLTTIDDKGVPGFQRTDFLPLRWTNWQVDLFDNPPIMGYLHRPVTVRLRDQDDKPLTGEAQVAALREGWTRAVGTLPIDDVPSRLFRDTRHDAGATKVLGPILKEQPTPLALDDMDQDFDIGTRIGDTGIASPFVQIALAT
ncbi:type VI lipase adapter Tla3 domain-containing protein, partial [Luteibacter sp.]|uniref:type VI lipase adapter Tla3 domain-containing protein n=1 Tax=Luteibacter sp. TaxID=1886636 RepID=UPI002F3F916B